MWHRFVQPFRNLILAALAEAARQGRDEAQPQDLSAAIAHVPECCAAQILRRRNALEQPAPADATNAANAIAPETMRLFEQVYLEAAELNDRDIGSDHLLLALLRLDLATELKSRGVTYQSVLREIRRLRRRDVGPDRDPRRGSVLAPLTRPVRNALQRIGSAYTIYAKHSIVHPGLTGDPHRIYDRMRNLAPVRRDPLLPFWVITGYSEAVTALRDPRFTCVPHSGRTMSGRMEIEMLPKGPVRRDLCVIAGVLSGMMVFSDPPGHPKTRAQMAQMFSPRNVAALRKRVQQIADELLDQIAPRGRMDLMKDFAGPLPLMVIAEILGFNREDPADLRRWANGLRETFSFVSSLRADLSIRAAMLEMRACFERIVGELRSSPDESLMSELIHTPGESIDMHELFANCFFLLAAGHVTTASTIGHSMRELMRHPDELQRVIDDPALIPGAIEEVLRMHAPVQWTRRRAMEDLEIAGVKVAKDETVMVSMGAANHDPRQFPDPHRFDVTRKDASRHITFGGGNHFCLGAGLARLELQIALATLLRRFKNFRIQEGFEVTWDRGQTLQGFESFPMTFDVVEAPGPAYVSD